MIKRLRDSKGRYYTQFRIIRGSKPWVKWSLLGLALGFTYLAQMLTPIAYARQPDIDKTVHELYCQGDKVCVPIDQFEIEFPEKIEPNSVIESQQEKINDLEGFDVIRTRYSRKDSCHNPRGNECLTAIGRDTKEGVTVACPRNIKLGTKIMLSDSPIVYVCEDRYSEYLDNKRGLPTIDVFVEDQNVETVPAYKKVKARIIK